MSDVYERGLWFVSFRLERCVNYGSLIAIVNFFYSFKFFSVNLSKFCTFLLL